MKRLIFATQNVHKLAELKRILPEYEILGLADIGYEGEIEEDGKSFAENALIKARVIHSFCGESVVSDDSGICVDALRGAPGIYSARFCGVHGDDAANNNLLLQMLKTVPDEERTAQFVSAAAVVFANGEEASAEGVVSGRIAYFPRGDNGFGYDPIFICDEGGKRYAEMSAEEKDLVSHRKRAFAKLAEIIAAHEAQSER